MKIEIDVTEEEFEVLCDNLNLNGSSIEDKVYEAYEAEKNKILVGDWYVTHNKTVKRCGNILWPEGKLPICKKLSQPLQDLLNKEIK